MTDPNDTETHSPPQRRTFEADGESVEVRQDEESGVFELRMPIASTGEVRNEGDDPLTRGEIDGMAQQIGDGVVSVFPDHGQTPIGGPNRYSIGEKGGEWEDAEVVSAQAADSDADQLVATARMMDPETLSDIPVREYVGSIKELADRDMSVPSSIGWADDDAAPGGVDLMEASLVGIPADPRTHTEADTAQVVARAAVDAGADPDALRSALRETLPDDGRPFGPPSAPDLWDDFDECVAEVEDWDGVDDPEAFCGWAQEQTESMTDESESADEQAADTDPDDEPDEQQGAPEWAARMLELQEQTVDALQSMREDDEEEDDEEEDDENGMGEDDDEEDEEDEEEQASDVPDEVREEVETLREELDELRDGGLGEDDVDVPDSDETQDSDDEPTTDHDDEPATKQVIK